MKKNLFFLLLAVAFIFSAHAQQWVNFSSSVPKAPEFNLLDNARTVSFTVTIPGIYTLDTVVNSTAFTRLMLSGGGAINPAGYPELPVLTYRVAIPDCEATEIEYRIGSMQTMPSCWVYPMPEFIPEQNSGGSIIPVEQFTFEPAAYAQPRIIEPAVIISSSGALRAQKYVEVTFFPIEFCPVTRQLSVIDQVEITLTFDNPKGDLRQNVGIFNKIASNAFINYEDDGISALSNDKAFEKPGFTRGNVQWITLNNTNDADLIPGDYLIITVPEFFDENNPNSQLKRLAEHRAFYNGFDVSIVNVDNILSLPFEYEDTNIPPIYIKEQKLRTFIRRVFEGKNAQGGFGPYGDGHLAYVLLVGDNYGINEGMPTSLDHEVLSGHDEKYPSDYYFSCITKDAGGGYDDIGDLFIGRFSVETPEHLYNMVQKTLNHETEYAPQSWRNTSGFTYAFLWQHSYNTKYTTFVSNLQNNMGWNYSIVDGWTIPNFAIKTPTLNYLNNGSAFMQYFGDCSWYTDECATSWVDDLSVSSFENELHNDCMAPFIHSVSNYTGYFDGQVECLGEFLTRYDPKKGAVGLIGSSRGAWLSLVPQYYTDPLSMPYQERLLFYLFNNTVSISIAGELSLISKFAYNTGVEIVIGPANKYGYNLLGDPALNILADGFEITQDVTADCPATIPCRVRIHNGATLTVPANCNLKFLEAGKLTVDENGSMVIGDGALVYGVNSQIDTVIHIKGGDFIVGEDVVFQDLPGGILLVGRKAGSLPPNYNLRKITFNNTPLTYRRNTLEISSCIFNQASNIKTSLSRTKIDSCSFNESSFLLEYALNPSTGDDYYAYQTFHNCSFTGNGTNIAMKFHNTQFVDIFNNTIIGYETAISLHDCGLTLVDLRDPRFIGNNNIANCGTGIELYNSVAHFRNNHIHNNTHGVKLFNNSYTVFYWDPSEPNIIQNCDSIELYASANSFPTYFKYNIISDASNQGNPSDIPLFWWDVEPPYPNDQDVKYNCWGNNFDPQYHLYPSLLDWNPVWDCTGKSGAPPRGNDEELYLAGLDYFANEDYTNAETTFKELIQNYPVSRFAIAALHELFALEHFTNNDFYSLNSFYATITPSDSNLFNTADFLATRCLVKERDWQPAVDWYEERITNPPSYQDSVFAVIDLGDIHLMMESDTMNGGKSAHYCHYSLPNIKPKSRMQYEENKTSLLATLPQIKNPKNDKNTPSNDKYIPLNDKKGSLGECVPNPTNGNATISYEIFTGGVVEIQLFNSIGQMVKSLPQGKLSNGNYKATISVVGMPVGVYHYTLVVNGERVDSKRVVVN